MENTNTELKKWQNNIKIIDSTFNGHNEDRKYRLFAYLVPGFYMFNIIRFHNYLKFSHIGKYVNYRQVTRSFLKKVSLVYPLYLITDFTYRNTSKKELNTKRKILYNIDLTLWHSIVTFLLPALYSYYITNLVCKYSIKFFNGRFKHLFGVSLIMIALTRFAIGVNDSIGDLILNLTYRPLVYDFKEETNSNIKIDLRNLNMI